MKKNRTFGIVARVACVLLCLVLFSAHLCSGMFARYNTEGEATGSARVAALDCKAVESQPINVSTNGDGSYLFSVVNNSEVAVEYNIIIDFYTSSGYYNAYGRDVVSKVCADVKLNDQTADVFEDGLYPTYTFNDCGTLAPGESSDFELDFTAKLYAFNTTTVSTLQPNYIPIGVEIFVDSTQID